jgi:hypothetical protein
MELVSAFLKIVRILDRLSAEKLQTYWMLKHAVKGTREY